MYPLISCIMPTCDRRSFIKGAIACYEAQVYPNKELVVVDNGADRIEDLLPKEARYQHVGNGQKLSTGAMRNRACELALGTLIAHWDDDDWSHPARLLEQYRMMQSLQCSIAGYNEMYFIDEEQRRAWLYQNQELYALGTSLLYDRNYWLGAKFPDIDVGEDTGFITKAQYRRSMTCRAAGDRLIARIHSGNTCDKKRFMGLSSMWIEAPYEMVRNMMPTRDSEEKEQNFSNVESSYTVAHNRESKPMR
jgi:glycosyltransferase involved in cell wall biosynthesis